jgi:AP-1 complex subunit beta-1
LLTCAVKLFLKEPNDTEEIIGEILEEATEEVENPDIRDRGYIYWRLLSEYPDEAKDIVLSDKPKLKSHKIFFDKNLVENLVDHISMISSVYHKTPG